MSKHKTFNFKSKTFVTNCILKIIRAPIFILLNSLTNFTDKHLINNIDDKVYQTMTNTHTLIISFILYFCNTTCFFLKLNQTTIKPATITLVKY